MAQSEAQGAIKNDSQQTMAQNGNHLDGRNNRSGIDRSGSAAVGSLDRGRIGETGEVVNGQIQIPEANSGPAFHPSSGDGRTANLDRNGIAGSGSVAVQLDRSGLPAVVSNATAGLRERNMAADFRATQANSLLPSEQEFVLPSEQANLLETLLPSEQSESDKQKAEWLKTLLPKLDSGWWDVAANGKGFIIKQKWREQKRQITQTYPRVSREQFQTLKGSSYAKQIISDRIGGHLDECRTHKLKATRERARCAAARLSLAH